MSNVAFNHFHFLKLLPTSTYQCIMHDVYACVSALRIKVVFKDIQTIVQVLFS